MGIDQVFGLLGVLAAVAVLMTCGNWRVPLRWYTRAAAVAVQDDPLSDETPVHLKIGGRVFNITWAMARDLYVRVFGIDAVQDCRAALRARQCWIGYSKGKAVMTVCL